MYNLGYRRHGRGKTNWNVKLLEKTKKKILRRFDIINLEGHRINVKCPLCQVYAKKAPYCKDCPFERFERCGYDFAWLNGCQMWFKHFIPKEYMDVIWLRSRYVELNSECIEKAKETVTKIRQTILNNITWV